MILANTHIYLACTLTHLHIPSLSKAERLNVDAFIEHFSTGKVRGFDPGVEPPLASCPLHGQWEDLKLRANGLAAGSRRTAPHRRDVEERLDTVSADSVCVHSHSVTL